jgi:tetratricopeptide (TPR) repeat protein
MATRSEPTLAALAALATRHSQARRFRAAAAVYRRIGKLMPDRPGARYNEAMALWALGDLGPAVALLQHVATTALRARALVQLADIAPTALSAADRADIAQGAASEVDPALRADLGFAHAGLLEA